MEEMKGLQFIYLNSGTSRDDKAKFYENTSINFSWIWGEISKGEAKSGL